MTRHATIRHGCPCCDGRMAENALGVWFCMDCDWRSDEDDMMVLRVYEGPSSVVLRFCPWCDKFAANLLDHGMGRCKPSDRSRMPIGEHIGRVTNDAEGSAK